MPYSKSRIAIAATAAAGLATAGIAASASASPRIHHIAKSSTSTAVTGSFKVTMKVNDESASITKFSGPKSVKEGVIKLKLIAKPASASVHDDSGEVQVMSFKGSYTMTKFKADLGAFGASEGANGPSKAGLAHLRNAIKHAVAYGGVGATQGEPSTGEVLLNRPGNVYIYNDSSNGLPSQVHKLKVKSSSAKVALPKTSKRVTLLTSKRFGGDKVLPAKGSITVTNKSTESPHFLVLEHVKKGTTRKEVLDYFQSNSQSPPSFALTGGTGSDTLTYGESQVVSYNLPKGEYIEACFFPDPKTGMPHAFMGMIGVVTLK